MGIQGLLPLLKSIERPFHLRDCAGMTLAVDGYVWLHKGAFACAQELCLGQPTQKVQLFRHYGVTPFIVFDGGYLPSKASTETERLARREASKKKAMDLWQAERKKEALDQFRKCVDVTPEMAFAVIQALQAAKVDFVVAPYEADAQLAYLEKTGKVHGIVTEDSDLLVFGCKRMIFKLDQYGSGIEIQNEHLSRVQEVSFHNWSMTEIRHMCILSGCDYLPSIPGMGLKTAHRMLRRHKTYDRVIKDIRMENTSVRVPTNYEQLFEQADLTFLYARVYDIDKMCLVHLNEVPEDLKDILATPEYDFLGPPLSPEVAQGIATGRLNPITKEPLKLPSNARPLQLPKALLSTGKENRPPFLPPCPPESASSKSILSYFTKPPSAPSAAPSCKIGSTSQSGSINRKREQPVISDAPISLKRQCSNEQTATNVSNTSLSAVPTTNMHKATESSSIVVESKSRFFGLEASEESDEFSCDVVPESPLKSRKGPSTIREDSGIGLDEIQLRQHSSLSWEIASYSAKFTRTSIEGRTERLVYCKESDVSEDEDDGSDADKGIDGGQEEATSLQDSSLQPAKDSCTLAANEAESQNKSSRSKAEESIIKGWRERFSNSAAPERSSGLTKAFEKMKQSSTGMSTPKHGPLRRRKAGSLNFGLPPAPLSSQTSITEVSSVSSESAITGTVSGPGLSRPVLANRNPTTKRTASVIHVHAHEAKYHLDHKSRLPLAPRTNQCDTSRSLAAAGTGKILNKPYSSSSGKAGTTPGASLQQMLQLDRFKYTPPTPSLPS
ncbi:Rad2 nuclease [Actinomortierella wolfii]|nr:Rad2 nuclease [Actinomortierella wolfii]